MYPAYTREKRYNQPVLPLLRTCFWLIAIVSALGGQETLERRAVRMVRAIPASKLDLTLPKQPFDRWLYEAATPAEVRWEANDCGEQSGNPEADRGRDFPLCVDATVTLGGGRVAIVTIAVGTFHKGISGPPKLMSVQIGTLAHLETVNRLSDLPPRLRTR